MPLFRNILHVLKRQTVTTGLRLVRFGHLALVGQHKVTGITDVSPFQLRATEVKSVSIAYAKKKTRRIMEVMLILNYTCLQV